MTIYVPHAAGEPPEAVLRPLEAPLSRYVGSDAESYYRLLCEAWSAAETFIVVEHDIVVGRQTIEKLSTCPLPWCAAPYSYLGGYYAGLGCMKFSAELIAQNPDALDVVGRMGAGDPLHPPRHWCALDARLQSVLSISGAQLHRHDETVLHLSDGTPSHGCREAMDG